MTKILHILVLLVTLPLFGQVSIGIEANKKELSENEQLILNIFLEIKGNEMIQESPLRLIDTSKFDVLANGSNQNTFKDPKGNLVNQIIYQLVLSPKKSGKIKIGSASVVVNGKIYYTDPFDILVKEGERKTVAEQISNDVYLNVELQQNEVYQNQPTVAVLRAYSKNLDNFRKVKHVQLPSQENVNVSLVTHQKSEIQPELNGASQIIAMYLVFPEVVGNVEIKPASADVALTKEKKIWSNKVKLNVKNLPQESPLHFKNAVGQFSFDLLTNSTEKIEVNRPVNIVVKLSGTGNFSNVVLPKIKPSADYTIYEPKIVKRLNTTKDGISGELAANYLIIPKTTGNLQIITEQFAYFDPESDRYIDLGNKMLNFQSLTKEQILEQQTPLEKMNEYSNTVLKTVDNPVIATDHLLVKEKNTVKWRTVLINGSIMLMALLLFVVFRNFQKNRHKNKQNAVTKTLGSVAETEQLIRQNLKSDVVDYYNYMENLLQKEDYTAFFDTVSELDKEIRNQYFQAGTNDFNKVLENHKGQLIAEQYRAIQQKIQMEKFVPVHQKEQLYDLLNSIKQVYNEIAK